MSEESMRDTAYNIAHNRAHGADPVPLSEQIYDFMAIDEVHHQAVLSANNTIGGEGDVSDLLAQAQQIVDFRRPPENAPPLAHRDEQAS